MMLNGGRLNAQVVNGSRRLPIYADAAAALSLQAECAAHIEVRLEGTAPLAVGAQLQPQVARSGTGTATMPLGASLDAVRLRLAGGELDLSIVHLDPLSSRVIRRASGLGAIQTFFDLTPQVHRTGAGYLPLVLGGELGASARRYGVSQPAVIQTVSSLRGRVERRTTGDVVVALGLEGVGQRHRRGSGSAVFGVIALPAVGTRRRTGQGVATLALEFYELGTTIIREGVVEGAGAALLGLHTTLTAQAQRMLSGAAAVVLEGDGAGEVHVRGEGAAVVDLRAEGTGFRIRQLLQAAEAVLELDASVGAIRWLVSLPPLPVATTILRGDGAVRRGLSGDVVLELHTESSGFLNIASADVDSQTFLRPPDRRAFLRLAGADFHVFTRPVDQREFARPADVRHFRKVI
ncbi:hypothetical protein HW932_01935 [Allochromatium humboldtianum]|uniref:Uncharacterized protein n=1 Tax=Allochromatium humboldtianum TaxID=504901 RepID=A0A850R0D1_9GAMM|nr:hypothetical protein [Allochromatium humboldtianum]NVZ08019.1 hypothetical protein [Allochromatium humboldtianum]